MLFQQSTEGSELRIQPADDRGDRENLADSKMDQSTKSVYARSAGQGRTGLLSRSTLRKQTQYAGPKFLHKLVGTLYGLGQSVKRAPAQSERAAEMVDQTGTVPLTDVGTLVDTVQVGAELGVAVLGHDLYRLELVEDVDVDDILIQLKEQRRVFVADCTLFGDPAEEKADDLGPGG